MRWGTRARGSGSRRWRRQIDMEIFVVDFRVSPLELFECFLGSSGHLHTLYPSAPTVQAV